MISFTQAILALAPLVSVVLSFNVPAPITSSSVGSKPANALDRRAENCDHCFTCFYFEPPKRVLAMVGSMYVPQNNPVSSDGTNFVWPGVLMDPNAATVLQPVVNGYPETQGQWSVFQNWLVGPDNTYGTHRDNSVPVSVGEKLDFSMKISADGSTWDINANGVTNNYAIHDDFVYAVFCAEFYQSGWNFGDLVFENVQIVAEGNDSSWCIPNGQSVLGNPTGNWENVGASIDENGNTVCNIGRLTMNTK